VLELLRRLGGTRGAFVNRAVPRDARSVLDIGSGEGWTLADLDWVSRRIGVDTDTAILERARSRYPECEFLEIDGASLPFEDGAFDAIILSEVIEHVGDKNKQPVIDEVVRLLRPGGTLVLTAPHAGILSCLDPLDAKRRYPWLYGLYRRWRPGTPDTPAEIGHKHVTLEELLRLFRGQLVVERAKYGSPFATLTQLVLLVARVLPLPERAIWRVGQFLAWESGIPSPRWLANTLRLVARKR
jgi:SAM-dependent methyltransferase